MANRSSSLLASGLIALTALGQETAPTVPSPAPEPSATPRAAALNVTQRQKELAELRHRLASLRARYAETKRKESDLKAQLEAADLNLQIRTAERRELDIRESEAERMLGRLRGEREASAREVATLQLDLASRVNSLYRMGRVGYIRTLVAAESGKAFLRGLQAMAFLARRDARLLTAYRTSLATLEIRQRDLQSKQVELNVLAAESRRKEEELTSARAEKAALLAKVQRTGEGERVEVAKLEDKSARLAALLDLLEAHGRVLPPGTASIRSFRGVLDWPVKGAVAVPFGRIANPKFPGTFLRSSGWTLGVSPGAEVRAVFSGEVAYAQWLKGYGNLVVLDHGEGVFTLYGRLANGTVKRGERVALGDVVGRLGETSEDEVAGLLFEIRDQRTSVDPRNWLR